MKLFIRSTDSATCAAINFLEKNKKYDILEAKRYHTACPKILLTIRYSEHETMDIFLPWRYSDIFTVNLIDIINTSSIRSKLVYKGLDESSQRYVLGIE
jgi:hypothetical protein